MMINAFLGDIKTAYKEHPDLESLFDDFSDLHQIRHKNISVLLCRRLPYLVFLHLPSPLLLPSTMVVVQLVYQPIYYKHNVATLVLTPTSCYRVLVSSCTPTGLVMVVMSPALRIMLRSTYHQYNISCTILYSWSTIIQLLFSWFNKTVCYEIYNMCMHHNNYNDQQHILIRYKTGWLNGQQHRMRLNIYVMEAWINKLNRFVDIFRPRNNDLNT